MLASLESSLGELERRLALQRQFVADASHELRTPLTTIRGNLSLLRRSDALTPEEQRAVLRDAVEESERMTHLLDEMLMLSSVGAGRELRHEPVDVKAVVEDACRKTRVLAPDRVVTVYAPDTTAMGDAEALRQVLLVLLDNALKYTLAGGRISVSVASDDNQVHIRVQDDGVGIDEAHLPRIFDRFYRADASRPGTGLGLSIARDLVERQGGALTASSRRGVGSVFTITLLAVTTPSG
jgi:signal transduction histidine kinase